MWLLEVRRKMLRLWRDQSGQDMIEYAMLAAFLTVAVAAFFPTDIAPNISSVFARVTSMLNQAPNMGGS